MTSKEASNTSHTPGFTQIRRYGDTKGFQRLSAPTVV
jgi:hypothetical protein